MNENPEGTPNPLNPGPINPEVAPMPEPVAEPAPTQIPVNEPMGQAIVEPMPEEPVQPIAQAIEVTETVSETTPIGMGVTDNTVISDTAVAEPAQAKKSSKKTALILAILFLLIAIGCGVAAILVLKPFGKDAVPAAISKLMKGAPDVVMINGNVTAQPTGSVAMMLGDASLSVDFKAGFNNKTSENYVNADINADLGAMGDFEFNANEIHDDKGNLYLKLGGISQALQNYYMDLYGPVENSPIDLEDYMDCELDGLTTDCVEILEEASPASTTNPSSAAAADVTNCIDDPTGMTNCGNPIIYEASGSSSSSDNSVVNFLGLISFIDDQWILIQDTDFSNVTDLVSSFTGGDNTTQCLVNAGSNLNKYGSDFSSAYDKNPFVTYSTENLKVAKKKDTIYKLSFDTEKFADFINAMGNSGFMNELNACTGSVATNVAVNADALNAIVAQLPEIYVEIDDDYNFTRVYLSMSKSGFDITADLSFSYPESIKIEKPTEYIDFNSVLSQALNAYYQMQIFNQSNY